METNTITRTLPDIDKTIATRTGDEILLDVARTEKVKRVAGSGRRSSMQSHSSRAWTRSGDVD